MGRQALPVSAQIDATKLLAMLLEAPDPRQAAAEYVGSLTEQFFAIASTYLTMVLVRPCLSAAANNHCSHRRSSRWLLSKALELQNMPSLLDTSHPAVRVLIRSSMIQQDLKH